MTRAKLVKRLDALAQRAETSGDFAAELQALSMITNIIVYAPAHEASCTVASSEPEAAE